MKIIGLFLFPWVSQSFHREEGGSREGSAVQSEKGHMSLISTCSSHRPFGCRCCFVQDLVSVVMLIVTN